MANQETEKIIWKKGVILDGWTLRFIRIGTQQMRKIKMMKCLFVILISINVIKSNT